MGHNLREMEIPREDWEGNVYFEPKRPNLIKKTRLQPNYIIYNNWFLLKQVNHVWQVGPRIVEGLPLKHAMNPENQDSKGILQLVGI